MDVYNKDTGKTVNLNIDDIIEKLYYNTIKLLNPKDKIKISSAFYYARNFTWYNHCKILISFIK